MSPEILVVFARVALLVLVIVIFGGHLEEEAAVCLANLVHS